MFNKKLIEFNKDCINLYYCELQVCELSQKSLIWGKIIGFLKENIELYSELEERRKRKVRNKKIVKNLKTKGFELKKENHKGDLDFYDNNQSKDDFDYDYHLQNIRGEKYYNYN